MREHEIGTTPRLLVDFKDEDVQAYDPSTIQLKIREPDGTITTKTQADMTNPSVGTWAYAYTVDQTGVHTFRFIGYGPDYDIARVGFFKGTDAIGS